MGSVIVKRNAPSGANYYDADGANLGLVVYESGAGEVTLQTDPTIATGAQPLGILVTADDNQNGGEVSVCIFGEAKAKLGAAYTPGTSAQSVMANGSSKVIAATDGNFRVGIYAAQVAGADGEYADIIVCPGPYEIS